MKLFPLLCLLTLTACAASAPPAEEDEFADPFDKRDPIRGINEGIFAFNLKADTYFVKPATSVYHLVPPVGRAGVSNFLTNLSEPSHVVNGVLQRDPSKAFTACWRFVLNSTFGFGGLRDFAGENGLKYRDNDFGKTLASYGVGSGAYLMWPIAGPSTVRDTGGQIVDAFIDPVGYFLTIPEDIAQVIGDGITSRDENDALIDTLYYKSLDPYASTRAAYLQHTDKDTQLGVGVQSMSKILK